MRIAVDLDEVLAQFINAYLEWHNKKYGTAVKRDDCHDYRLWYSLASSRKENEERITEFFNTRHYQSIKPVEGATEAILSIAEQHELFVVTSRPEQRRKQTKFWINKHFPDAFSDIYFTDYYTRLNNKRTKSQVCKMLKAHILIEDNIEFAKECSPLLKKALLLDAPWNRNIEHDNNIIRVHSWREVIKIISHGTP